ncbi:lysis protein [Yokenella regensburgei]|uniref:lysis protein n=1 Tax=Yokenella regensburgei TaxID=158877 RepID=UPI003ED9393D
MNKITAWVYVTAILLISCLCSSLYYYRHDALDYKKQRDRIAHRLMKANDEISVMKKNQRDISSMDKKYTEELNVSERKNDYLRRQLSSRTRRVYIKGKCPVHGAINQHISTGMGYDSPIELDRETGQDILDLRADIIKDNAKLRFLQEYISKKHN